jgi:hypothetical protein
VSTVDPTGHWDEEPSEGYVVSPDYLENTTTARIINSNVFQNVLMGISVGEGLRALKFFKGAGKTVDDILSNASPGRVTKGKTTLYEKPGGFGQASKEFDSLNPSNVKEIKTPNGTLKTGTLSDGRSVTVRSWSTDGRPTLEIRNSNGRGVEVRYGE